MTDYTRRCIWELPAGSNGLPDFSARRLFANLKRPSGEADGGSVFLATAPTGDLIYADYDRGEIRRIHYYGANVPPVASFTATPSFGPSPLSVDFDASGSTDANGDTLTLRLGPRRRRPVRRRDRGHRLEDLHGHRRRRGRAAGVRPAGRHPDDEPDRLGRQRVRRR